MMEIEQEDPAEWGRGSVGKVARELAVLERPRSLREVSHENDAAHPGDAPIVSLRPRIDPPEGGPLIGTAKRPAKPALGLSSLERACLSARVAAENKARDVRVLDMRAITPIFDYFVLATGASRRQIHAICEDIDARLREQGDARLAIEGYEASKWVVQDYGDLVVHVFDEPTRAYYGLEDLWADAPQIDWERA